MLYNMIYMQFEAMLINAKTYVFQGICCTNATAWLKRSKNLIYFTVPYCKMDLFHNSQKKKSMDNLQSVMVHGRERVKLDHIYHMS